MLLTCKCLNVSITIKGSEIQPLVDFEKLGLSASEAHDSFFKDKVGTVELGEINKEQSCLVNIRHVGDWLVHRCLNCDMQTHAIHRDKRGECVIVNQNHLMTDAEQIVLLKSSDAYSEVFRIVTNHDDVTSSETTVAKISGPLQAGALALQQQLVEAMRQQTALVEERVRAYTEQQYAELEVFRKTAHDDQRALLKLLQRWSEMMQQQQQQQLQGRPPTVPVKLENVSSLSSLRPASLAKQGPPAKSKKSQPTSAPGSQYLSLNHNVNRDRSRQTRGQARAGLGPQGSLDTEGLFDLEGMEEATNEAEHFHSEDETDDTDESGSHDEGIHIPRHRSASQMMAKSLPVNVPAFHLANSAGSITMPQQQDYDSKDYPDDRMDIAASIKALAQSVHGGASVFGDLPRPRFSTQL